MHKLRGKKILITGAAGFLGSWLAAECFAEDAKLYGIDIKGPNNINIWSAFTEQGLEGSNVNELFSQNHFDIIFHLAGGASVGDSVIDPEKDFKSIVPPTLTLIQKIKKYCVETHLILFSSAAVYGNPAIMPVKETAALHPLSPYGIHKLLVEDMVKHYSYHYGFRSSVLRIFSAFGEGLRKQLFWDVMCRYEKEYVEKKGDPIMLNLFGTGKESRDFIHCKDVAKAAVLIATADSQESNFNVYNVAGGDETRIKTAVEYLFQKADIQPLIKFNGESRVGDPEKWQADICKLNRLGFVATMELQDCLNTYYTWFMKDK